MIDLVLINFISHRKQKFPNKIDWKFSCWVFIALYHLSGKSCCVMVKIEYHDNNDEKRNDIGNPVGTVL